MSSTLRPVATTGVALLSAGMIAASPLVPPPTAPAEFYPLQLTAGAETWLEVFDEAGTNLNGIFDAMVSAVTGDLGESVQPFELLAGVALSPLATMLGVTQAIGGIPDVVAGILTAGDPLDMLAAVANVPAGIVGAFLNGHDFFPGLLTWDIDGTAGSGLLGNLLVGVPAMISTLLSGSAAEFSLDSLGFLDLGFLDVGGLFAELPAQLMEMLTGIGLDGLGTDVGTLVGANAVDAMMAIVGAVVGF